MAKAKSVATAALVGAAIAGSAVVLSNEKNRKKLAQITQEVKKQGGKALAEVEKGGAAVIKLVSQQARKANRKRAAHKKASK